MPVYLTPQPGSPFTRALAAIIGAVMLVGAFMLGIVAFVIALGVSLIAGAWLWFRNWRFRKAQAGTNGHVPGNQGSRPRQQNAPSGGDIIDAEYKVITPEEPARSDQKPQN